MKYRKDEILEMLISSYKFQAEFDSGVKSGMSLNYETTILEWMDVCDLLMPTKLAKYFHKYFQLNRPLAELECLLKNFEKNTISDFCEYISEHAERQKIVSITLLRQKCETASIFRRLKQNLSKQVAYATELKPSSKVNDFFLKSDGVLFEEVNRIAPGTLSEFEYRANKLVLTGQTVILLSAFFAYVFWAIWFFHWLLILPIAIGIALYQIGMKKEPEKLSLGGFEDFRELIYGMKEKLEKVST
ncbi:hypothetical protein WIW50_13315 [Flavobacteriaceae bacterium 3-367]